MVVKFVEMVDGIGIGGRSLWVVEKDVAMVV